MPDRWIHESYREVRPAAPIWISDSNGPRRSALLLAWRQGIPPDGRTYWYGLVATAEICREQVTYTARWVWEPHVLPVPNGPDDQHSAWERWADAKDKRPARRG